MFDFVIISLKIHDLPNRATLGCQLQRLEGAGGGEPPAVFELKNFKVPTSKVREGAEGGDPIAVFELKYCINFKIYLS